MTTKKKRVFIGIPFTAEARRGVEKVLKTLERKHWLVKWEEVEKLHITLAFLGWIDEKQMKEVAPAVAKALAGKQKIKPFTIRFKGLGAFPQQPSARVSADGLFSRFGNRGKVRGRPDLVWPRVIWVGLKGDLKSLARLYKGINTRLESEGFKLDQRPFVPHITLGRIKGKVRRKYREDMGRQLAKLRQLNIPQQLEIKKVVIYESKMTRKGSKYTEIARIKLGN